ncbi:hypothetical protein THAOC_12073 [Thalassiosira oceanica]|uniref:Uncharacterized protein n=1 Tax=Thalassiosira oceanica TaxID=159749 RepID=K0SNK5_THAOC|nr:hypothetical protein THAOC_12073 [Thalassiosira oceanica]|eukprot:EJK66955.1 hypothetical protein THAOC_12073 [Thalassiosira oceanica]
MKISANVLPMSYLAQSHLQNVHYNGGISFYNYKEADPRIAVSSVLYIKRQEVSHCTVIVLLPSLKIAKIVTGPNTPHATASACPSAIQTFHGSLSPRAKSQPLQTLFMQHPSIPNAHGADRAEVPLRPLMPLTVQLLSSFSSDVRCLHLHTFLCSLRWALWQSAPQYLTRRQAGREVLQFDDAAPPDSPLLFAAVCAGGFDAIIPAIVDRLTVTVHVEDAVERRSQITFLVDTDHHILLTSGMKFATTEHGKPRWIAV